MTPIEKARAALREADVARCKQRLGIPKETLNALDACADLLRELDGMVLVPVEPTDQDADNFRDEYPPHRQPVQRPSDMEETDRIRQSARHLPPFGELGRIPHQFPNKHRL